MDNKENCNLDNGSNDATVQRKEKVVLDIDHSSVDENIPSDTTSPIITVVITVTMAAIMESTAVGIIKVISITQKRNSSSLQNLAGE